jgi:PAS domain-containing protein
MLSSVLKSERAIEVNIQIMRVFTRLRQMLLDNADLRKELEDLKQISEERFRIVFETLDQLLIVKDKPKKKIGFTVKEKPRKYRGK